MTKTQICSLALSKCGANLITDYDDSSREAVLCRNFYDTNYQNILRCHKWHCAMKRAQLAKLTTTPLFGWDYEFALPNDYLQIIQADTLKTEYSIEGKKLLTNESAIKIKYISLVTDLSQLDSWCIEAIYVSLASKICYALTQDASMRVSLLQELNEVIIPQARFYSAIEQNESNDNDTSSWLGDRL